MRWHNNTRQIFEKELFEFFLNDKYNDIVFRGCDKKLYPVEVKSKEWYYTTPHCHTDIEIMIVLEGECTLEYENDFYKLEESDIAVTESNLIHRERALSYEKSYKVAYLSLLEKNYVRLFATFYSVENGFFCLPASSRIYLKDTFLVNLIKSEIHNKPKNFQIFFYNYLKTLYLYLHRELFDFHTHNIAIDEHLEIAYMVETYIENNYNTKINLNLLSSQFNINASHLCNIFRKYFFYTITEFLNEIRIKYSIDLLRKTDRKISDIAYMVGYEDQYYFSKVFKLKIGRSPTEFRKMFKVPDNLAAADSMISIR